MRGAHRAFGSVVEPFAMGVPPLAGEFIALSAHLGTVLPMAADHEGTDVFRGASFTEADFAGAKFRDCDLRGVKIV